MTDETVQTTKPKGKGRTIDDSVKIDAVARVKKSKERGVIKKVAAEVGVHPITISDWVNSGKYGSKVKKTGKKNQSKATSTAKNVEPSVEPNNTFSLRKAISNLPTSYEGLLREHIKLLLEVNEDKHWIYP
jgi:transposase-like protein